MSLRGCKITVMIIFRFSHKGFLVDLLGRDGQSLDPQRISDYRNAMVSCLKNEPFNEYTFSDSSIELFRLCNTNIGLRKREHGFFNIPCWNLSLFQLDLFDKNKDGKLSLTEMMK